ncbi:MAG: hypothetical protein NC078_06545 [Ruminococcus sp.]|nr:hypothetical protein [Ruminococcus sp.]
MPEGKEYTECDVNYSGRYRGSERIIFSDDGYIYYTGDHYGSFTELYGGNNQTESRRVLRDENEERRFGKMGVDGLKIICGEYGETESDGDFSEGLRQWREKNDIYQYYRYAEIGDTVIITATSGWFAGNAQTAHVLIWHDGAVTEIDAEDIENIEPIYFADGEKLYCCDNSLSSGFKRFIYAEYDLTTGEKVKRCGEEKSLGDTSDRYETTDPDIDSLEKLREHICEVSGEWYCLELREFTEEAGNV